jgi:hypothetical protein
MRLTAAFFAATVLLLAAAAPAEAQEWGTVTGRVTAAGDTSESIPAATVLVAGTDYGTSAGADGRYRLRLPTGAYRLRFSSIGFEAKVDSVTLRRDETVRLDVRLAASVQALEGVEVTADREEAAGAGIYEIDGIHVENMPTPLPDGFRALKALPGVATNNELSSQYSVRGGGYNENLIFINGFEVYMPFRPRQGEQEGLGLWNPQLTDRARLYAGGFPARYGGKLSSALEVEYRQPEGPVSGQLAASTLDVAASAGASALDGRLSWLAGARKARAGRLFGTQELEGDYAPDYTDVQASVAYTLAEGHQVEALGLWSDYEFTLDPRAKRTYFGTISLDPRVPSDLQSLFTEYEGQETDGYTTRFAGGRLTDRFSTRFRMEHEAAFFQTTETERLDVTGSSLLTRVDPVSGKAIGILGVGEQHDVADNRVTVSTLTGRGRYYYTTGRHAPEAGWHLRRLAFEDRIDERSTHTVARTGETFVVNNFEGTAEVATYQAGAYVQDVFDALPARDRLLLTAGLRSDYYAFNEELTLSPRFSARFEWTERTTLNGALGLYHQKPTYRELRGEPPTAALADTAGIESALNRNLQSQRALQFIVGGEHFFPERRLYLRAEAYYARLSNLISYETENVRVQYSGENDARGYNYGFDLQLRGEFVPGLESWFNYSFLVSREDFREEFEGENGYRDGLLPRPADQRHTFSAFIQDYVPGDKSWKLHMRALFGSGLPYTPPVPGDQITNTIQGQAPGPRMSGRYPEYRRLDVGATKVVRLFDQAISGPMTLMLTAEVLNLFDMTNTVAYNWDADFNRIPTHLTPRTVNVRMRLKF